MCVIGEVVQVHVSRGGLTIPLCSSCIHMVYLYKYAQWRGGVSKMQLHCVYNQQIMQVVYRGSSFNVNTDYGSLGGMAPIRK